jgi:hypothetical protein
MKQTVEHNQEFSLFNKVNLLKENLFPFARGDKMENAEGKRLMG